MSRKISRALPSVVLLLLATFVLSVAWAQEGGKPAADQRPPEASGKPADEAQGASDEAAQAAGSPLGFFERLIGGRWEIEGSYQEFEWGVGKRSVISRTYFVLGGKAKRVAEGLWYWHPGAGEIRGVFTAVDMPVELFEYTTRFEDGRMISQLRGYASGDEETEYTEIFEFKEADSYEWSLFTGASEGGERVMGGTFHRSR